MAATVVGGGLACRRGGGNDGPVDGLDDELARIAEREPVVRAWVRRHSVDHLRGELDDPIPGPLDGWTLGVKDVIDVSGMATERGSPIYAGRRTRNDAACVDLARRAGAIVVGKTATTEFALVTPAVTTNPHNPDHTPGGSSSGSAAAVADHMVRAALGTQTVGSVLRPAAFCGVVGFKPTRSLIPLNGVGQLAPSFDTLGWFTRSVADATAMFEAMTSSVPLRQWSPPDSPDQSAGERQSSSGRRLRIGKYRSHQWSAAQPEMAAVLDSAADQLADSGVEIVDVDPLAHLDGLFDAADTVLRYEIGRVFAWERDCHLDLLSPLFRKMLIRSDAVTVRDYGQAHLVIDDARRAHREFMAASQFDALLTPSAPGEAPSIKTTGDSAFNRVWTSLGVPAIHLPTGTGPLGLPVGIQLAGNVWADTELLTAAAQAEAIFEAAR